MADKRSEILEQYLPTPEGHPDTQAIYNAMDENGRFMCLDLLIWMYQNSVSLVHTKDGGRWLYKNQLLTNQQLFENFL